MLLMAKQYEDENVEKYNFTMIYARFQSKLSGMEQQHDQNKTLAERDVFKNKQLLSGISSSRSAALKAFEQLLLIKLLRVADKKEAKLELANVRLHHIHPTELELYIKSREGEFASEVFEWATVN